MTLIKKLMLSFGIVLLLVLLSTLASLSSMQKMQSAVQLNEQTFNVIRTGDMLAEHLMTIESGLRGFVITGQDSFLAPYIEGKKEASTRLSQLKDLMRDKPEQRALISNVEKNYMLWLENAIEPAATQRREAGDDPAKRQLVIEFVSAGTGKMYMDKIRTELEDFMSEERGQLKTRSDDVGSAKKLAYISLVVGGLLILVVAVGMATYMKNALQQRLMVAKNLVAAVAAGRLNNRIDSSGGDEVAELLAGLDVMQTQLCQLLGEIKSAAGELSSASSVVASTAEQLNASANEQSRASSSIAAAVEELSVSINHVSGSSAEAHQIATDSGRRAEQSGTVINNTVASMERIALVVRTASNRMEELGKQSEQISNIVSVIKGIADQTNLLALNAAIEAARAGEQGRGFAVVADEVRMLAQRTTQSTSEISSMIGLILSGTSDAVGQMGTGVVQVNQGVELAAQAGSAIAEIQQSFKQVLSVIEQISLSLNEQNAASQEVAGHIERIAGMSAQNSEATQHSSKVAHELKALSSGLTQAVSRFTL
ncbi:MAG: methyl-accepting chemotaxis protein [Gammaproteobacteria bacterium]|nr:methyl-accepting chemotaxis protein [Gammaproteobacteria bacterium]